LELPVLSLDVLGERLVVVEISLQGGDLPVPEIQLVLLAAFRLAEHMDLLFEGLYFVNSMSKFLFKIINLH